MAHPVTQQDTQPPAETLVRITREEYPEIIQAARWMDEDNGTPHFEPGVGFIVDDPDGLSVPIRWVDYLPVIEAALAGLDHERPHPDDVDTLEWLAREGKEPTLYESAVHCFVSGEHTPMTIMARSSRELYLASRFFNERFEGWAFDPTADFEDLTRRAGGDAGDNLRRIYDALPKGPRCRDCGDEDGRCPPLRRPCDPTEWVIELIQSALALPAPVVEGDVEKEARFLCDRLAEFEREITDDDLFTQFNGHVAPSAARLRAALSEGRSHG